MKPALAAIPCLCVLTFCALPLAADDDQQPHPPATIQAVPAGGEVVIDGKLDEAAWTTGPWQGGYHRAVGEGEPSADTKFALRFDERNLYWAVRCEEPNVGQIKADAKKRDDFVWRDDCVELMIDARGNGKQYAYFAVNSKGTVLDMWCSQSGENKLAAWNADLRVATRVGEDFWTVEMAIPLADLGIEWRSGQRPWRMLTTRARRALSEAEQAQTHGRGGADTMAHVPTRGGFHNTKLFGPLTLAGATIKPYMWEFPGRRTINVYKRDGGGYLCRVSWALGNITGQKRDVILRATLAGLGEPAGAEVPFQPRGKHTPFVIDLPVETLGEAKLTITVADQRDPGRILARRSVGVELVYRPLEVCITRPFYRNSIYATQMISRLQADGRLNLPDEALATARPVRVRLYPAAPAEAAPLAETNFLARQGNFPIELPLPDLPNGSYVVETAVKLPDGSTVIDRQSLHKLPPVANEWRIDRHRRLLHNGKAFLPYGQLGFTRQLDRDFDGEGITCVYVYHTANMGRDELLAFLDDLYAEGIYAVVDPWPASLYRKGNRKFKPLTDAEARLLVDRVNAIKHHPAICAWYLWDEPDLQRVLHERFARAYREIRRADPYHPIIQLPAHIWGVHAFADTCDVLMPDPYPWFVEGPEPTRPIRVTSQYMAACRQAVQDNRFHDVVKSWWITPQSADWATHDPKGRTPNLTELRCQQLQAFIGGARGLLWYTDRFRENSVDLAIGLPFLGREAGRLREALLAPEQSSGLKIQADHPEHLHAAVRRTPDGHWYLLAVNTRVGEQNGVRFQLPDLAGRTLYVVSENRSLAAENGSFTDDFARYEGHVYTTDPTFAFGPTLSAVQTRIDAAKSALARPGNLAHDSTGATVTASSRLFWSAPVQHLNDGHVGLTWRCDTSKETGDWLQIDLPRPARVGRLVLKGSNIERYRIDIRDGDEWKPVREGVHRPGTTLNVVFEPAETSAVRLVYLQPAIARAAEIELYAD